VDPWPTPCSAATLVLDVTRSPDGRLDGQVRAASSRHWRTFSGVLELLKALEEILDIADLPGPTDGTEP